MNKPKSNFLMDDLLSFEYKDLMVLEKMKLCSVRPWAE
jgi:hypothetical protein